MIDRTLTNNKWEETVLNLFVVLLFFFINPIYALFICAFLNLSRLRFNYWIFSFMFAVSFALLYFLKDYGLNNWEYVRPNSDVAHYVTSFQNIDDLSWSGIISRFITSPNNNEPFFWFYVKIANILFFGNADIFLFFHYFLTFFLLAYLGKIVHNTKYVLIIVGMLFLEYYLVIKLGSQLRNTTAFLLFFTGICLFDAREKKWLPRIIIYSAGLFHITVIPIIIFYESLILFTKRSYKIGIDKLYYKNMVAYLAIMALVFIALDEITLLFFARPLGLYGTLSLYYTSLFSAVPYEGILFNWFTYGIILSLWLRRKKLVNSDVFMATQYFMIIFLLNELNVPDIFSRYQNYIMIGGAILIGRLGASDFRLGFIMVMFTFIRFYQFLHFDRVFNMRLTERLHNEFMDPVYGLGSIILNYDSLYNFNF